MMGWDIEGVAELLALDGVDAPIHVHREEAFGVKRVTGASDSDLVLHDGGDVVSVGDVEVTLVHTPGHTPGSQCFLVDGRLVAGDTLFLDGCGRTDLPGGDADELYYSLTQRLAAVARRHRALPRAHVLPRAVGDDGRDAAAQLRVPPADHRAVAHDDGRMSAPLAIRDSDIAVRARAHARRARCGPTWRSATPTTRPRRSRRATPTTSAPKSSSPPTGRFIIVLDEPATPIACGAIRRHDDDDRGDQAHVGATGRARPWRRPR